MADVLRLAQALFAPQHPIGCCAEAPDLPSFPRSALRLGREAMNQRAIHAEQALSQLIGLNYCTADEPAL